jgi:hypothetical protein
MEGSDLSMFRCQHKNGFGQSYVFLPLLTAARDLKWNLTRTISVRRLVARLVVVVAMVSLVAISAFADITGDIQGTVLDATGAARRSPSLLKTRLRFPKFENSECACRLPLWNP